MVWDPFTAQTTRLHFELGRKNPPVPRDTTSLLAVVIALGHPSVLRLVAATSLPDNLLAPGTTGLLQLPVLLPLDTTTATLLTNWHVNYSS